MSFGTFAPLNEGSTDNSSARIPVDQGIGGKANSFLVEQAWSFSPANFVKPGGMSELPAAGYGGGAKARLEESSQTSAPTSEARSLRAILPGTSISGRAADITTQSKPVDLIEALSPAPTRTSFDVRMPTALPGSPFAAPIERQATAPVSPVARQETGPMPALNRDAVASPATTGAFDVKAHPLFANISREAKAQPYNFNARMDNPVAMDNLSRQIMSADFSSTKAWSGFEQPATKTADPFAAANCYQTMEFCPDGTVKTTTTLPDLTASKIESIHPDKSRNVALTDHLGRSTTEQRFDATGHLVSHTSTRFDHEGAPMSPSQRTVQTATQTIETKMDTRGTVVASKIMPYSDLDTKKSIG